MLFKHTHVNTHEHTRTHTDKDKDISKMSLTHSLHITHHTSLITHHTFIHHIFIRRASVTSLNWYAAIQHSRTGLTSLQLVPYLISFLISLTFHIIFSFFSHSFLISRSFHIFFKYFRILSKSSYLASYIDHNTHFTTSSS